MAATLRRFHGLRLLKSAPALSLQQVKIVNGGCKFFYSHRSTLKESCIRWRKT
ncbi:GD17627 [Drosophila simulans]|uniref:GD17627 n=1 Tax=Drosophila simulans TaxID=7240 RepID=B4NT08_DROSI|nr:GD17627 [Drosophila simulans]